MSETERRSRGRNRPEAMFPAPAGQEEMPPGYGAMLDALKERIGSERLRVAMAAWTGRAIVQEVLAQSLWHHSANLPCFKRLSRRGVGCDRQAQLWRAEDTTAEVEAESLKLAQPVREIGRSRNFNRPGLRDCRAVALATMITRDFEEWGI